MTQPYVGKPTYILLIKGAFIIFVAESKNQAVESADINEQQEHFPERANALFIF
jgi:hypothetical protein